MGWPEFQGVLDAGHNGNQGDEVPLLRVGVVTEHEGIVAVEEVIDAQADLVVGAAALDGQVKCGVPPDVRREFVVVDGGDHRHGDQLFPADEESGQRAVLQRVPAAALVGELRIEPQLHRAQA